MHPILFYIFKLPIGPYGLLLASGLVLGVMLAVWRGRRVGVGDETILDAAFFGTLAGIAGGRIAFILTHWALFIDDPVPMLLDRAGFQFLGGLVLGCVVGSWSIRRRGERILLVGDVVAPSVALGHALGRVGCFFSGCCYGKVCPTGWEWAGHRFPLVYDKSDNYAGSPVLYDHIEAGLIEPYAVHSLPVWPTQLVEAAGLLLVFAFLMWLWKRRTFEGQIFAAYLYAYGVLRFLIEFLRGDVDRGALLGLSTSQWLSLLSLGLATVFWVHLRKARPIANDAPPTEGIAAPPQPTDEPKPRRRRGRRK